MKPGYFNVLRPIHYGTGKMFTAIDKDSGRTITREYFRTGWKLRGTALSMEDAKEQFGGAPVLEWVDE